jgi:hypothetical protein
VKRKRHNPEKIVRELTTIEQLLNLKLAQSIAHL